MEKTKVFNLIILDESGSMSASAKATISGCNETLNVARELQKRYADRQDSFVSIYAFQSDGPTPSRYLVKNERVEKVRDITAKDYRPYGCTPLLDAVGSTLVDLKSLAATHNDAMGIVTIITDGYENSSTQYDWKRVADLIARLKELGWTFNFIGANIDVEEVASRMNIDNSLKYESTSAGTSEMFSKVRCCLNAEAECRMAEEDMNMSHDEKVKLRKSRSRDFFDR